MSKWKIVSTEHILFSKSAVADALRQKPGERGIYPSCIKKRLQGKLCPVAACLWLMNNGTPNSLCCSLILRSPLSSCSITSSGAFSAIYLARSYCLPLMPIFSPMLSLLFPKGCGRSSTPFYDLSPLSASARLYRKRAGCLCFSRRLSETPFIVWIIKFG